MLPSRTFKIIFRPYEKCEKRKISFDRKLLLLRSKEEIYSLLIFMRMEFSQSSLDKFIQSSSSYPDCTWYIYWHSVWNFYLLPTLLHTSSQVRFMNFHHVWSTFKFNFLMKIFHRKILRTDQTRTKFCLWKLD